MEERSQQWDETNRWGTYTAAGRIGKDQLLPTGSIEHTFLKLARVKSPLQSPVIESSFTKNLHPHVLIQLDSVRRRFAQSTDEKSDQSSRRSTHDEIEDVGGFLARCNESHNLVQYH